MKKVEVFKTNVQEPVQASHLVAVLQQHFPGNRINFDLHDCDKILRVEGRHVIPLQVMMLVEQHGYSCNLLE